MAVHDDDDVVEIPRADIIHIRAVLAEIEEAGGLKNLKTIVALLSQPGVKDAIETLVAKHITDIALAKMKARWWKLIAWLSGIAVGLTAFIASLDGALTAIRGWFR